MSDTLTTGPARNPTVVPAWRDPLTWIVAGLVCLPLLIAVVRAVLADERATSDWALLELRIRDVGSADTPFVGPYSRFGWNHPGPLLFLLIAPFYRLLGADGGAMFAGAAILNLVCIAGILLISHRLGGRRLMVVTGLGLTLLTLGAGPTIADPWNPYLALLPFALFLLAAASVANGDLVMLPVAIATGSFTVQAHIGYAVLVALVALWATAMALVMTRRRWIEGQRPTPRRLAAIGATSLALLALAWVMPAIEQATTDPGNLTEILDYFTTNTEEPAGWAEALRIMALEVQPVGPWLGGGEPSNVFGALSTPSIWWALPLVALLIAAGILSWRRRDSTAGILLATVLVAMLAGLVATSRVTGITYFYLVRSWWAVAMLGWVTVAWVAVRQWPRGTGQEHRILRHRLTAGVVALLAVGCVVNGIDLAGGPAPEPNRAAIDTMADPILGNLNPGGTYAVLPAGQSWGESLYATVNLLVGSGRPAYSHPYFITELGERRVFGGPGVPERFDGTLFVATTEAVSDLDDRPGLRLLASYDPLTPAERAEYDALTAQLMAQFEAQGRGDLTEVARLGNLNGILGLNPAALDDLNVDRGAVDRLLELRLRGVRVAVYLDPTPVTAGQLLQPG